MSEYTYTAEFATGARAKLTISPSDARIEWTPEQPRGLSGKRLHRFLASYRRWRDECINDFARRTGITVMVIDL